MVLPLLLRGAASLAAKKGSKELAKQGAKRGEKFMGMVDEVPAKRLADGTMKAGSKSIIPPKGNSATKAALAAGAVGAGGVAMMEDEDKAPKRVTAAPRGDAMSTAEKPATEPSKASTKPASRSSGGEKKLSSFGSAFKAARSAGLSTFEWNGKKYNTMQKGESKEEHKEALKKIKDKNEAAYEKKIKELAMRKGGMAKKGKK